jgi:hypothetical protein
MEEDHKLSDGDLGCCPAAELAFSVRNT